MGRRRSGFTSVGVHAGGRTGTGRPGQGKAGLHTKLLVLWIVTFLLTSFFIENDWVIWTPMHLYILHLALLPICVFRQVLGRIERATAKLSRTVFLAFLSLLLSVPVTLFVTSLAILPWEYFGKVTGIETMGRQGPAKNSSSRG